MTAADIAPRDLREVADRALQVLAGGDAPEHRHRAELLDRLHVTCSALTACVRAAVLANVADAPHPDEIAAALDHVYHLGSRPRAAVGARAPGRGDAMTEALRERTVARYEAS